MKRVRFSIACSTLLFFSTCVLAQLVDDESKKDAAIAARFFSIVEKNPQRGTALEKVFAHHLQRGTLDAFVGDLEQRTKSEPEDGVAWMLLGLFESQRRMDAQAIIAFEKAEKLRPKDALAAYYRGQCLLRTGEAIQAVVAFEIAIQRNPPRVTLLDIFEQLGRTHQLQNRNDLAIDVWKRLEALFPDDPHVLEQIASIQNRDQLHQEALPRYERLIDLAKDAYQRTRFRMEAAQLRIKLGNQEKGLAELESILSDLKPDGWLYRDVQRKIEEAFIKSNDQDGLIQYYETRLAKFPDDVESIIRLCKFLTSSSRFSEANQWMTQAIERAPSRLDLRKSYIDQLIADQQLTAASEQYSLLSKLEPNDADILKAWGKLVLRDPSRSIEEAKVDASNIWSKMLEHRSKDALAHIQVAELLQSAKMPEHAQKLFERAVEIEPGEAQYREYLGQFLFQQNQREQAFAAWDAIAEGSRRNADSVMRLAEIYDHAKQRKRAAELASESCRLAPQNSSMFMRAARFQKNANLFDEALESLTMAEKNADRVDEREFAIQERINILEACNRLKSESDVLQKQLRQEKNAKPTQWQLLAQYLVRQKRWQEARAAVNEALRIDENNVTLLLISSEIAEGLGDLNGSIVSLRKLAQIDKRKRQEYLERIAKQQMRQRQWTDAIETAKEVVQAVPSKIEGYEFLAQVCFQARRPDLGIETLRKAIRIDPDSSRLIMSLGSALSDNDKYNEAIELYWQAFAKANNLDDKVELIVRMVKTHQRQNTIPSLIDRLESGRKDPSQRRDLTICLAQVHQSVSDFASAKRTLEELLSDLTRDTAILRQLARLSLAAGDLEMAIDYQRQLIAFVPGQENESYLANLLRQHGDWNEANEIVVRLLQSDPDPAAAVQNIDGLLQKGEYELVLQTLEPMLRKQPDNWELLFRRGLAHAGVDQWAECRSTLERFLTLDVERSDSSLLRSGQSKNRSSSKIATVEKSTTNGALNYIVDVLKVIERPELADVALGRASFTVDVTQGGTGQKWSPENYGEFRIACIACLVCCDSKDSTEKSNWIRRALDQFSQNATSSELIDALAIVKFQQDTNAQIPIAAALAASGEPEMQAYFLEILRRRQVSGIAAENKNRKPLSAPQIELMLASFEVAKEEVSPVPMQSPTINAPSIAANANIQLALLNSQSASMSAALRTNLLQNLQRNSVLSSLQSRTASHSTSPFDGFVRTVVNELRFAERIEQAEAFVTHLRESANTEFQLRSLCEYLLSSERFNDIERPLLRWFELHLRPTEANDAMPNVLVGTPLRTTSVRGPSEFAVRLVEIWGEQASKELMIRILNSVLKESNQKFTNRAFPPLSASSLVGNQNLLMLRQAVVQTWCTSFVSDDDQKFLQSVKKLFTQANQSSEWMNYLQSRVEHADASVKPLERLRLALSVDEQQLSESLNSIVLDALKEIGREQECALHAAAGLLSRKNFQESRKIVTDTIHSNPQGSILGELIALHASTSLNDKLGMEASLRVLAEQKLDSLTLQSISSVLQKARSMGISVKGLVPNRVPNQAPPRLPAVATRLAPKSSMSQAAARLNEMNNYVRIGNQAEAAKVARQIVSKPRSFSSASAINGRAISGTVSGQSVIRTTNAQGVVSTVVRPMPNPADPTAMYRKFAFDVLKRSGELETLIFETEQRLASSPKSFVLTEQLAEFYEMMGDAEHAEKALFQALRLRPGASQLRDYFAEYLRKANKHSEACDQYIELMRRDPSRGLSMIPQRIGWFESCGRTADLLKAIQSINYQAVSKRDEAMLVARSILNGKGFEIGAVILEKLVEQDPANRKNSLRFVYGHNYGYQSYPRLLSFSLDALVPNETEAINDPWFGLQEQYGIQLGSDIILFETLLKCHRQEDVIKKLEPEIQAAVDRMPGWFAGQFMLALIAASTERGDEAKKKFFELAQRKRLGAGCPEVVVFRMAKEISELPGARDAAIRLLETLVGSFRFVTLSPEAQPNMMLAKLLVADGQRERAIDLVKSEIENLGGAVSLSLQNSARTPGRTVSSFGDYMLFLGFPVEAYRIFDAKQNMDINSVERIAQNNTNKITVKANKRAAIAMVENLPAHQAVFELLQDRTNTAQKLPALELMLEVPLVKETPSLWIESILQTSLLGAAKVGQLASIEKGIQDLLSLHPSDITILASQARVRLAMGAVDTEVALTEIERIAAAYDPEIQRLVTPAENVTSRTQTPDFVRPIVSTWLVAKQCYEVGKHLDYADRLANRAYQAAMIEDARARLVVARKITGNDGSISRRVNEPSIGTSQEAELANIILFEWGRIQIRNGRLEPGAEKWRELVDKICKDSFDQQTSVPIAGGVSDRIWTRRQFEWLLRLANVAVDESRIDISIAIAAQTVKRRIPVQVGTSSAGHELFPKYDQHPNETFATDAVRALLALMERWGDGPSESVRFDILLPLVLPDKYNVLLYEDQTSLLIERPNCLAAQLVQCAAQANRLNELKEALDQRNVNLNWRVLRTQIAIAEGDLQKAKALLAEFHELYQISKTIDVLTTACQVAIPAFQMDELREAAFPIVNALLTREKESGKHSKDGFKILPLVIEVDQHIRARLKTQLSTP